MNSPTHIYYDLSVYNYDPDGMTPEKPFNYLEIKPQDFISNPSDYFLSITRFSIETSVLPVFIPMIELNQNDPTKTIYVITMEYLALGLPSQGVQTTTQEVNVVYTSFNPNYIPTLPVDLDDNNSNPYYYVYTYQQFIDSLNKSIKECFNQLQSQLPSVIFPEASPFIQWDPSTYLCTLFGDAAFFDDTIKPADHPQVKLYFNSPLMNLFRSFPARFMGHTSKKNWQLMFYATNNGSNTTAFETYNALTMFQERESISLWNPIMNIVFMSNHLQPVATYTGVPQSDTNLLSLGDNNNFANILTDFQVALSKDNGYNGIVYFAAVNPEERMLDLRSGGSGINTVDLQVYWKSRTGQLVPLYLHSNCYASVKLLFRKKSFNYSDY